MKLGTKQSDSDKKYVLNEYAELMQNNKNSSKDSKKIIEQIPFIFR